MSNYTTQTAALKAVTIDTTTVDAKRIDTKKLFVNGQNIIEMLGGAGSSNEYKGNLLILEFSNGEPTCGIVVKNG